MKKALIVFHKLFLLSVICILAASFYDFGPLWFYIVVLLPLFVFAAYSIITTDFEKMNSYHRSSSNTTHKRSYHASPIFRHSNLMGTSSLSDRIRTFGR